MERREFLKASGLSLLATAARGHAEQAGSSPQPNILLIMTDQQFGDGMSCVLGREHLHTPNMDALAEQGMRFTRAYSPNPLCVPMRTSMITGHYPHQTGIQTNKRPPLSGFPVMGKIFRDAGYETAYFGKWHVPIKEKDENAHGFETFVGGKARLDPSAAADFLKQKHDRPFLAVASFLSPHEICEWARKEKIPGDSLGDIPPVDERPPMRQNAGLPENETDIMTYMRRSYQAARLFPVGDYTEDDWRRHVWGYYRLIERADRFTGALLTALRESGQEENTVVVFVSDHGDCHGAHRWNQKTVFYDESARVPFIISQKGRTPRATSDLLVNVGVDMIPTLCELAGIAAPGGLPGRSMAAPAFGRTPDSRREYLVSQNHMIQGKPVDGKDLQPEGRMVRSDRYKYCLYSEGERRESLVDMQNDPGETVNLAGDAASQDILVQHRAFLKQFAERHGDKTALQMLKYYG